MGARTYKKIIIYMLFAIALVSFSCNKSSSQKIEMAYAHEMVVFNTQTLKYHCPSCKWTIKCTKNCILVEKKKAINSGGIPCKVCGGTCY